MKNKSQEFIVINNDTLINNIATFKNDLSKNSIKKFIKHGMVSVNNNIITNASFMVNKGDKITICYNKTMIEEFNLKILYEDKDIVAISKPSGLLSISNSKENNVTAFKMVREYVRKNNPHTYLFAIHRLDQDTSGVLIFGKNEKIKNMLQDNWNNIVKKRGYYAIIEGDFPRENGTFKSYLKENKLGFIYSTNNKSGKYSVTNYKKIKCNKKYSMMDIDIDTGRRNQIRVHFSEYGYPIVGDKKYGSKNNAIGRLALHAYELSFIDPRNNKTITIKDNIPKDFINLMM